MTNITKAAKQALAELADWHWSQAATLRKAASTSAMDKPEPVQSSITRMADWHDAQKSLIRAALQDKAGEVRDARFWLEAVVDIWSDGDKAPEHRCYVEGAFSDAMREASALLAAQPAPAGPAGFALVPWEPTDAMVQAGVAEMPHFTDEPGPVWSAMIAASQQPFLTPNQPKSHDS